MKLAIFKKAIHGFFKHCIDFTSILMYESSVRKENSINLLNKIKNIHNSKRAFIVCNGPSLRADDLTKIYDNKDISFGANKINSIFKYTDWRPTYYCVFDEGYQHSILSIMNEVPAEIKFFRQSSYRTTRNVKSPSIWLNTDGDIKLLECPRFSEDIKKVIYTIATVTYAMVQIAVYMGIRELYIIGCDNQYAIEKTRDGKIINHGGASYFKGSDIEKTNHIVASIWQNNVAYEYLNKYASENDIKIFNATRGGHLEAFPRVNFDNLF